MFNRNKNVAICAFIIGMMFLLKQFIQLPDFIYGIGLGTGLALELIGLYSIRHPNSKLKIQK